VTGEKYKAREALLDVLRDGRHHSEGELAILFRESNTNTDRRWVERNLVAMQSHDDYAEILIRSEYTGNAYEGDFQWHLESRVMTGAKLEMDASQAIAFDLARHHLRDLLPEDNYQSLSHIFEYAQDKLKLLSKKKNELGKKWDFDNLKQRVIVLQRGHQLKKKNYDHRVLQNIYDAIAQDKWVTFDYRGKPRGKAYYPGGVIHRPPKIFFHAATKNQIKRGKEDLNPFTPFLVNYISNVEIVEPESNEKPGAYSNISFFVRDGWADVLLKNKTFDKENKIEKEVNDENYYDVEILVFEDNNLIRDLTDFPIGGNQNLKDNKNGTHTLTFQSRRTYQLIEYIISRGDRFKVVKPDILKADIRKAVQRMLDVYDLDN